MSFFSPDVCTSSEKKEDTSLVSDWPGHVCNVILVLKGMYVLFVFSQGDICFSRSAAGGWWTLGILKSGGSVAGYG